MNEKPWMLPKGQTIWHEGEAIDPYQELAALQTRLTGQRNISEGLRHELKEIYSRLDLARAVISQFVHERAPMTPEQKAAWETWQAMDKP